MQREASTQAGKCGEGMRHRRGAGRVAQAFVRAATVWTALWITGATGCASRPQERVTAAPIAEQVRPHEAAARAVIEASLMSDDPQIRAHSAEALLADPAWLLAVSPTLLADENQGVRAVTAAALGDVMSPTDAGRPDWAPLRPVLRGLTKDDSVFVRLAAVYAIAKAGDQVDRAPLAVSLMSDPLPRVRAQAAFFLGRLDDRSALPMLREAANARMPMSSGAEYKLMQLQIAEAMVRLGEVDRVQALRAALFPSRPQDLEATALAVQVLGDVGDRSSIDQLIYLADQRDEGGNLMPAEIRLGIAGSLAKLGQPQGWFIAGEYAKSESPLIRAQAAAVYGLTRGPENGARLGALLQDPAEIVRVAAAAAVIRNLPPRGAPLRAPAASAEASESAE